MPFIVTDNSDLAGDNGIGNTGNGAQAGSQVGTLRQAINYANANPGTTITFGLAAGQTTITLLAELPLIFGSGTVINGALAGGGTVTVDGGSGGSATAGYRVFFVGDAGQIPDGQGALGGGRTAARIMT